MRRVLLAAAILAAGPTILAGCGTSLPLPTETRLGRLLPSDKSYRMVATWTSMTGIQDLLLTQGPGSQLFLLFQNPGVGPAPRGGVYAYAIKAKPPTPLPLPGFAFRELFNPTALCGAPNRVFVLDQGDTALARDPVTQRVTDPSMYWRVREYGLLGGDTISTFTDTSMAFVRGVAADDQGHVYVSGTAIVLVADPSDARIITRSFLFRVYRYQRVTPGSVPPDPYMPGTDRWVRDRSFEVEEGSGQGSLMDPRGLYWVGGGIPGGPALLASDFGKDWVQELSDAVSSTPIFKLDGAQDTTFDHPEDAAADLNGFLYVADTGNRRVLRFDPYGAFVQKVNVEADASGAALADPVAVAADDSLVYVADRAAAKVVRYQRRK